MSFLSRTVTAAFVDTAELFTAVENTKLMWTQRQRQMAKDEPGDRDAAILLPPL